MAQNRTFSPARLSALAGVLLLGACSADSSAPPELESAPGFRQKVFYLEAPCEVNVEGIGMVDVEEEYIPGVVACENGNAPLEALKAQAVQARSFLYYKLFVAGQTTIRNSQADQVYSCSYRPNGPDDIHRQAAAETKGEYLEWENSIVASFYVAGAIPPNPDAGDPYGSCMGNGGSDPTSTQRWVTYNRGKTGCDIDLTNLGFVPDDCRGNPHNRGCASQNGEACLAGLGIGYRDMMKFHYGDDIVLAVGTGRCGADPLSAEDQFCVDNGNGSHCFDASTVITCENDRAAMTETCTDGCGEGACIVPTPAGFCADKTDGNYCDGASAVICSAGEVSLTEACMNGCAGGICTVEGNTGGNNLPGNNGANNGGGPGTDTNNATGGENPPSEAADLPPVVGASPGIDGGCSTAAGGQGWLSLVGLGLVFGLRRRR